MKRITQKEDHYRNRAVEGEHIKNPKAERRSREKMQKMLRLRLGQSSISMFFLFAICLLILGGTLYMELHSSVFQEDGTIARNQAGGSKKEVSLILNADGLPENYAYDISVEAEIPSEDEANAYFKQAEEEIDASFWAQGESADRVTQNVNPKESYADGIVTAEWQFDNYHYITTEGVINTLDDDGNLQIPEEGVVITAEALLQCGEYEENYSFFFQIFPADQTKTEQLLSAIESAIRTEMDKQGSRILVLPKKVNGISLNWSEKKDYLTVKVLFWEILLVVLLKVAEAESAQEKIRKRKEEITREYPEIVSKLSILMGAGMTLKQAWTAIAGRYEQDRKDALCQEKPAYEEMKRTLREIRDGESERNAYQRFGERCQVPEFYRLSRVLVRNLQKGNKGLCTLLQKEADDAFEERKLWARKKGEEAGTKMLVPLMMMMIIVIAIVIVPAFLSMNF